MYTTIRHELCHARKAWPSLEDPRPMPSLWSYWQSYAGIIYIPKSGTMNLATGYTQPPASTNHQSYSIKFTATSCYQGQW